MELRYEVQVLYVVAYFVDTIANIYFVIVPLLRDILSHANGKGSVIFYIRMVVQSVSGIWTMKQSYGNDEQWAYQIPNFVCPFFFCSCFTKCLN